MYFFSSNKDVIKIVDTIIKNIKPTIIYIATWQLQ
jgi:hypothetical protein